MGSIGWGNRDWSAVTEAFLSFFHLIWFDFFSSSFFWRTDLNFHILSRAKPKTETNRSWLPGWMNNGVTVSLLNVWLVNCQWMAHWWIRIKSELFSCCLIDARDEAVTSGSDSLPFWSVPPFRFVHFRFPESPGYLTHQFEKWNFDGQLQKQQETFPKSIGLTHNEIAIKLDIFRINRIETDRLELKFWDRGNPLRECACFFFSRARGRGRERVGKNGSETHTHTPATHTGNAESGMRNPDGDVCQ